jgi:hypothetical protein
VINLKTGDKVYILGRGYGLVSLVDPDGGFGVKIEGHGSMLFNPDGTVGAFPVKRAYRDNPIVVEPTANARLWKAYVKLTRALYAELKALDAEGQILEPED